MGKTVGFIFARGGSQGLRKKNIHPFLKQPLITHSIKFLKSIKKIDSIYVSSDNNTILEIAKKNKVNTIKRPLKLSSNNSSEWSAWKHGINYVKKKQGDFSTFVSIPPTAPLRTVNDIRKGLKKFESVDCDICISYTKSQRSPYFNIVKEYKKQYLKLFDKSYKISNRQDVPVTYDITTLFYIASPDYILNNSHIFDGKVVGVEIPKSRSIDIDDILDLKVAEFLKKYKIQ